MSIDFFTPGPEGEPDFSAAGSRVAAGFPSPAEDYLEPVLDLNRMLIKNPSATFLGRAKGDGMKEAGVEHGDLLIIDKSLACRDNALAVCYIDGEFTLKWIKARGNTFWLASGKPGDGPIRVREDGDLAVWGIVTYVIKKVW